MRRRAWIICTVVAALAVLALVVMWVRSYRVADGIGYGRRFAASDGAYRTGFTMVRSSRGVVYFGAGYFLPIFLASGPAREGWFYERAISSAETATAVWSLLGFRYHRIGVATALVIRSFGVPYWFLTGCAAAALAVSSSRLRRPRRTTGTCATCGYDLRESRERCPECGTPIPRGGGADNLGTLVKEAVRQS